jgi:hypothetical protein
VFAIKRSVPFVALALLCAAGSWAEAGTRGAGARAALLALLAVVFAALGTIALTRQAHRPLPLLGALALAVIALFVCLFGELVVSVNSDLCGPLSWIRGVGPLAGFVIGPVLGRRGTRWLLAGWPLATLLGFVLGLVVSALVPGAHGYCES